MSRLRNNFKWLCIGKAAQIFNSLFVMAWVARYLGTGSFGKLASAVALVSLTTPIVSLGMDRILARELVANPDKRGELLGTAIFAKLGMAVLVYLSLAAFFFLSRQSFADELNTTVYLICLCAIFATPFSSTRLLMESKLAAKVTTLSGITTQIVVASMRIICVVLSAPLVAFAASFLIGSLIANCFTFYFAKRLEVVVKKLSFSFQTLRTIMAESWPLMASHVAVTFYLGADVVMLAWMRGDSDAGVYSFAASAINTLLFFPQAVGNSYFPSLVEAHKAGESNYQQRQLRYFRVNAAIATAVTVSALIFIPSILLLLLGQDFAETGPLFRIQTLGLFFFFFGVSRGQCLVAEGRIGCIMYGQLSGLLVNVLLNLMLIPSMGTYGAAIATTISYATYGIISSLMLPSLWPIAKMQFWGLITPNKLFPLTNRGW